MATSCTTPPPPPPPPSTSANTIVDEGGNSSITVIHSDILQTHILTRLDGLTLVSTACTSTELNSLASQEDLWTNICRSTWPSTDMPRLHQVISTFPRGSRSFFADSYPLISNVDSSTVALPFRHERPSELISAVDIYYCSELVFSKVVETETLSAWFQCSPFRIDMLDPKETCPTPMPHPKTEEMIQELAEDLTLSWVLIDPDGRRGMDLSSHKPVSVQRHWLSGEVHARFASILTGEKGSSLEYVQCGIVVTFGGGGQGRGMHVMEVSLQVEDMDGMFLKGKDSLGILHRACRAKRGIKGRKELQGRRRYEEFLGRKRERKERKLKAEGTLDMLCAVFGILIFSSLGLFLFLR